MLSPFEVFLISVIIVLLVVIILGAVSMFWIKRKTDETYNVWKDLDDKLEEQRERFRKDK